MHYYINSSLLIYKPRMSQEKINCSICSKNIIYVIVIPDHRHLHCQITHLESNKLWNPRGRFVIVLVESSSTKTMMNLLSELWQYKVLNSVVIQVGISNTVDIYTWFPFRSPEHCTDIKVIDLIDKWLPNNGGMFLNSSEIFPNKISKNLHKCPLVASVVYWKYYVEFYYKYDIRKHRVHRIFNKGLEVELFRIISRELNMTPTFIEPVDHKLVWGALNEIGESTGVLGDAKDSRANISIAGLPKNTDEYEQHLESTISYQESGFYWYVRCPRDNAHWKGLALMFTPLNWAVLMLVNFAAAVLLWSLGKRAKILELVEWKNWESFLSCYQIVLVIMLNSSTVRAPQTTLIRVFFLLIMYYAFAFNLIFQTVFTQRLIDPGKEYQVSNLKELLKSDIKITLLRGHEGIFRNPDNLEQQVFSKFSFCEGGIDPCIVRLVTFGDAATVMDNKMFQEVEHKYMDEKHEPFLCRLNGMIMPYRVSMYVTRGLPLLERMDDIIDYQK